MDSQERDQGDRTEQRDIRREAREMKSVITRKESDDTLLREIFKMHDALSGLRENMLDYNTLKRDVARHDSLLMGDSEHMGAGGIVSTLTIIKRDAAIIAGVVGIVVTAVVSGLWELLAKKP